MKKPLVSIVMNCLNGERYLKRAIDSVYAQTYNNWEIIFIDNGSMDASSIIAQSYSDKVRIFSLKSTVELGEARNLAVKEADGKFIAFLDVDDEWLPSKIERQVGLFKNPDVGIVFCNTMVRENGKETNVFEIIKPYSGVITCRLIKHNFITTSSLVYRKSVLEELPFIFRKNFLLLVDYDLSIRVSERCLSDFIDEPMAIVYKHKDNASFVNKNRYFKESEIFIKYLYNKKNKLIERCPVSLSCFMIRHKTYMAELEFESGNIKNAKKIIFESGVVSMRNIAMYIAMSLVPKYKFYVLLKSVLRKTFHFFYKKK